MSRRDDRDYDSGPSRSNDRDNYNGRQGGYDERGGNYYNDRNEDYGNRQNYENDRRDNQNVNYDDRRGRYEDDRNRDYDNRPNYQEDRRDGQNVNYDGRRGSSDVRRENYNERQGNYDDRRGNYGDDRNRDYDNRSNYQNDRRDDQNVNNRQDERNFDGMNRNFGRMQVGDGNRGRGGGRPNNFGRGRGGYNNSSYGNRYAKMDGTTLEKKNNVSKADLPYQKQTFVARPDRMVQDMNLGRKTKLTTNFVKIIIPEEPMLLHQYNVKISSVTRRGRKEETKREKTHPAFWNCYNQNRNQFPQVEDMIYNDVNILWTKIALQKAEFTLPIKSDRDGSTIGEVEFKYANPVEFCRNPRQIKDFQLLVCLIDNIATARARCIQEPDYKNFSAFGHSMFLVSDEARKHDFGVPLTIPLGGGMEGWTGLHMAIKMNLLVGPVANLDLSHSVFYKPSYSIVNMLADIINNRTLENDEFEEFADKLRNFGVQKAHGKQLQNILQGVKIVINYEGARKRPFKINRITEKSARSSMFTCENQIISIADYYSKKGRPLRFPDLPCVVGPKQKGYDNESLYPLEMVETVGIVHKFKGRLPESQLARMIQRTAYAPAARSEIVRQLSIQDPSGSRTTPALISSSDKWMQNYQIQIESEFIQVDASVLPPPKLLYGNSSFFDENHHGVWKCTTDRGELRTVLNSKCPRTNKTKVIVGSIITVQNSWGDAMASAPDIDIRKYETLMESINGFGQPVHRNEHGKPYLLYTNTYHNTMGSSKLRGMLQEIKAHVAQNFEHPEQIAVPLVLFIFATKCTSVRNNVRIISDYGIIKQLCDCEIGIHCQGILQKTMSSIAHDYRRCATAHNISFKILSKIGTVHYSLERGGAHKNWSRFTDEKEPTLVLGVDVTHPSDVDRRQGGVVSVSVACVVGNIDVGMSRYADSSRIQESGEESIIHMNDEVKTRITDFHQKTGLRPAHIVVYRDGISESEFKRTLYEEKESIEAACKALDEDYKPTLTYIVVSKRHHTRFFPNSEKDMEGEFKNVKPGTLVEGGITTNEYYDFYLTSHFGAIGTSRPTHYYVLYDTWQPSDAFWPTITHALCYNYIGTTKAISVPAPVQYAHLAAKRAKDRVEAISNIHSETHRGEINLSSYQTLMQTNMDMMQHRDIDGMLFA